VRLTIPILKVDAKIQYMGVTPGGAMDVPTDVAEAGWYKYGPHPGDAGSAVIGGHLNGVHGEPGVFLNLKQLKVGDAFTILDDTGKNTLFVVQRIQTYGQDEQPAEVFHSTQGIHVNLITCTGAWNKSEKRFSRRLVVFADKS
jgi:LPXTG-site transpeptidase (sortase) family protein